jgi:hypothetical protein
MLAMRISWLEDAPVATVDGRTITGPREQLAAAMPSWRVVEVEDGPSIDVAEWMERGGLVWRDGGWMKGVRAASSA